MNRRGRERRRVQREGGGGGDAGERADLSVDHGGLSRCKRRGETPPTGEKDRSSNARLAGTPEGRHIPTEARRHHPLCPSRPKTFLLSLTLQATMAAATMMDVPPMTSAPMPMPLPPAKPMTKEEEREAKKVIRWRTHVRESLKKCSYLPCTASAATARLSRY